MNRAPIILDIKKVNEMCLRYKEKADEDVNIFDHDSAKKDEEFERSVLAEVKRNLKFIKVAKDKSLLGKLKRILNHDFKKLSNLHWNYQIEKLNEYKAKLASTKKRLSKLINAELYERRISGIFGIFYVLIIFISLSITFAFRSSSLSNKVKGIIYPIEAVGLICHLYCAVLIALSLRIKYLERKSDPYQFITKFMLKDIDSLFNVIESGKETTGFSSRKLDPSNSIYEIMTLTGLGIEAYGTSNISLMQRKIKFKQWFEKRHDIFRYVCNSNSEAIGYICILPFVNSPKGESHYKGEISQFDITPEMIARKKSNLCFLQGMYIQPQYSNNASAIIKLIDCFHQMIADFMTADVLVYAEPITEQNNKMFHAMGFSFLGKMSKHKNKFYELDVSGKNVSKEVEVIASRNIDVIKYISDSKCHEVASAI